MIANALQLAGLPKMAPPRLPGLADLAWLIHAQAPMDGAWSKNAMWGHTRNGHTFLRDAAKDRRQFIADELALRLPRGRLRHNVLWVMIHVAKPDHRTDAANVVDLVLDAVELATGLNDRWYCLAGVTWGIDQVQPRVHVWVGQQDLPDALACSGCGIIRPMEDFPAAKAKKPRHTGQCRDCAKSRRQSRTKCNW